MERIYFTLSKILYPENLALLDYASTVKKLEFLRAKVLLYAFRSDCWVPLGESVLVMKKASVLPSVYVVWVAKATKKSTKFGVEYETSIVDEFRVFPLDHTTKSGKNILQYLKEDHPKVTFKVENNLLTKETVQAIGNRCEYLRWLQLQDGMVYLAAFGFTIVNSHDYLLSVITALREDPEQFVNDHVTQDTRGALENLILLNPFSWKEEMCCNIIALLECKIVLTRELHKQAAYVEYQSLVDQVLCALEVTKPIVRDRILHYIPEVAMRNLEVNLKRWSHSHFVFEGENPICVYLKSVADQEHDIIEALTEIAERNEKEAPEFKLPQDSGTASVRFIRSILSKNKSPYALLHGPGGSGKTYTITSLVDEILNQAENCNVGAFGFMGKTAVALKNRVVNVERPDAKSYIYASTIDSFLARRQGITLYENCTDNAPPEKDSFGTFLTHLRYVIVDEIGLCDRNLLAKLLQAVKSTAYKVIFVGDYHQILSIGPGNCMQDLMKAGLGGSRDHVVFELTGNKRATNSSSSVAKNASLLYTRPKGIGQKLLQDHDTVVVLTKECDLVTLIEKEYRKHGASNVQVYTRTNSVREKLIQNIVNSRNHSLYFETKRFDFGNFSSERRSDHYLLIGTRIMVTKNTNATEALYYEVDKDLIKRVYGNTLPSTLEKLCNYKDPRSGTRVFVENAKAIDISTPYVCNGEMDTVQNVSFVFQKTETNAVVNHAFLYTLSDGSKQILVGSKGVPPEHVVSGICTTVCKMQGSEAPVCVFVVDPYDYKMNYRELIVAFTRARQKLVVVVPAMAMLQQIVNTDGEIRKSLLYEKLNKLFIS